MERGDIEVECIFGAWRSCKFRETELSALLHATSFCFVLATILRATPREYFKSIV